MKQNRTSKVAALQAENVRLKQMLAELQRQRGAICTCGHGKSQHHDGSGCCNVLICPCCKFIPDGAV
jgi:hypothetical protein